MTLTIEDRLGLANERRQVAALYRAFLARFFENEISQNSRDLKASFLRIVAVLSVPGFLLPVASNFKWQGWLVFEGDTQYRILVIGDKVVYLSLTMAAIMLLTAVVWQALLVDRRDAIVLGSFPVRPRTIIAAKVAALLAYVGIVGGGMQILASFMYGLILATSLSAMALGMIAHFVAGALAAAFACVMVAAFQALVLAIGGARVFARLTASAQMLLTTGALVILLFGPAFGAAAVDLARGNERAAWAMWLPPVWFAGIYELLAGTDAPVIPVLALRAVIALVAVFGILVAAYPLAYRRIASAALQGSPLGSRQSIGSRLLARFMRTLPVRADVRGAAHFILLTTGRVARNKLIGASALGAALALSLPYILRWAAEDWVPHVPARSHIAVPFVFVMFGLVGLRMAYNVPSEGAAAWIFSTAERPARIGTSAARVTGILIGAVLPSLLYFLVSLWFWGPAIAIFVALTLFAFGALISEIGLRSVEFVPYTRAYNPERGNIQSRWPLFLVAFVIFVQFLPWAIRVALLNGAYWIAPAFLASAAVALRFAHPPEPPQLVDADMDNKLLALRLY
ncbi:MAG: hypothetical protein WD690_09210 [Vicinamibacterales bacterium]